MGLESRGKGEEKARVKLIALAVLTLAGCHAATSNQIVVTTNDLDAGADGNTRAPIDWQAGSPAYNGAVNH